jgi:hypothetical protein
VRACACLSSFQCNFNLEELIAVGVYFNSGMQSDVYIGPYGTLHHNLNFLMAFEGLV